MGSEPSEPWILRFGVDSDCPKRCSGPISSTAATLPTTVLLAVGAANWRCRVSLALRAQSRWVALGVGNEASSVVTHGDYFTAHSQKPLTRAHFKFQIFGSTRQETLEPPSQRELTKLLSSVFPGTTAPPSRLKLPGGSSSSGFWCCHRFLGADLRAGWEASSRDRHRRRRA